MQKRSLGIYQPCVLLTLLVLASPLMAQQQRNRPAAQTAPVNSLKVTYRTTTGGQPSESTTMIRGSRERSEMRLGYGMDMVNITQCDLKRTLQISDKAQKYLVTSMEPGDSSTDNRTAGGGIARPTTQGGVVTYTTTAIDTGERRDMFGFKARHVKSTMTIASSPDACNPVKHRTETDGWYIDFSANLTCDLGGSQMAGRPAAAGGCRDRVQFKHVGAGRTGFPLIETTTMYGADGSVMFTSSKEVVELSREPLDAALFDVPPGYTEAQTSQELYSIPSMASMTGQTANDPESSSGQSQNQDRVKAPGRIRVGVVQINNRSGREVSTDSLRDRLIAEIQSAGIEAVSLNALSQVEAGMEAKAKQVDFILYTDITGLKASKLGGMFGRVAGVSGAGKTETKIEFKLFLVGESSPRLQSAATAKEEGDEASAGTAISQEARMVTAEVNRKRS